MEVTKHSEKELAIAKEVVEIISKDALLAEKAGVLESIGNFTNQITNLEARVVEIDALLAIAESLGVKTEAVIAEELKLLEELQAKEII